MNIFVLDYDIELCAQYHCDKHVVKQILETAQLLCGAHHVAGTKQAIPYRLTHKNHPCARWIRASINNYRWLCRLGFELCNEYTHRYGKFHKCEKVIEWCGTNLPDLPDIAMVNFAQAMPDDCKNALDAVAAYRKYYNEYKRHLFNWTKREVPYWIGKNGYQRDQEIQNRV